MCVCAWGGEGGYGGSVALLLCSRSLLLSLTRCCSLSLAAIRMRACELSFSRFRSACLIFAKTSVSFSLTRHENESQTRAKRKRDFRFACLIFALLLSLSLGLCSRSLYRSLYRSLFIGLACWFHRMCGVSALRVSFSLSFSLCPCPSLFSALLLSCCLNISPFFLYYSFCLSASLFPSCPVSHTHRSLL